MPKPKLNCVPGETIVAHCHGHWMTLAQPAALLVTACAAWWILPAILATGNPSELFYIPPYDRFGTGSLRALGVLLVVTGGWLAVACLARLSVDYTITNRRVVVRQGVLMRRTRGIRLDHVESTVVQQSLAGRIFGYGSLKIVASARQYMVLRRLPRPEQFRQVLLDPETRRPASTGGYSASGPRPARVLP